MKILKLNIDGCKNKMKISTFLILISEFLLWKLENFKTLALLSVFMLFATSQDGEKLWKVFITFHLQKCDLMLISLLFHSFHFRINGPLTWFFLQCIHFFTLPIYCFYFYFLSPFDTFFLSFSLLLSFCFISMCSVPREKPKYYLQ